MLENQHHFLTTCIWDALDVNAQSNEHIVEVLTDCAERHHKTTTPPSNHASISWRSDVHIILPGCGHHTGGSQSVPTVHPMLPKGRRLWVAQSTPTRFITGIHLCTALDQSPNINMVAEPLVAESKVASALWFNSSTFPQVSVHKTRKERETACVSVPTKRLGRRLTFQIQSPTE